MVKERVLIGVSSFAEADERPLGRLRSAGLEVTPNPFGRRLTGPEVSELMAGDVVGLIAGLEPLDRGVLAGSRLRVISRVGVGLSNVDLDAARELGIDVRSTPDAPTSAVAELTLGAALALLRGLPAMDAAMHDGRWERHLGTQLGSKTVVIVGFGRVGRRVAELLAPFGARVLVADPNLDSSQTAGYPLLPLADALPQADLVTLHASGEDRLLDAAAFAAMTDGVFVLNAARGALIDEGALAAALDSGKVAGAWLDTFVEEPYSGPLRAYASVLLTPHAGSNTRECRARMEAEAVDNLLQALGKS
ncbi:MAG: hydroxyacid dehydrogenase [Chloroflexi bacterium]|nr:hydroxyacid dehydrogenase [Chloroflexota bacterium]